MISYLAKHQPVTPWGDQEIFEAAKRAWRTSGGDLVMIRISDLASWADQEWARKMGEMLYGKLDT